MAGLTNKQKKEWARTEFLVNNLSQKEVAKKVGISANTMSKWVNDPDDNWDELRKKTLITKDKQLKRHYSQLDQLNFKIEQRPDGERFPDSKEADIIKKLTSAIKDLESEASIDEIVNVQKRLLEYLRTYNTSKAIEMAMIFNDFVKYVAKGNG